MPVPLPVTSPTTTARLALMAVLADEFSVEGFTVVGDILHRSLGRDGKTRIGVSPLQETQYSRNALVNEPRLLVQFYGAWPDKIDPKTTVDPTKIETYAERFRRALHGHDPKTNTLWFFDKLEITYPHDPTGNATRFEARVTAMGSNSMLVETTG